MGWNEKGEQTSSPFLSYLADKNRLLIVLGKQARHQVVGAGYLQ